jgi:hypothetical protein
MRQEEEDGESGESVTAQVRGGGVGHGWAGSVGEARGRKTGKWKV